MQKGTATYVAPFGDNKVVEMGGVTFTDGKSVDLNSHEHGNLLTTLEGNPHFDVTLGKKEDDTAVPKPKVKRGRPSNVDIAAAKAAAVESEQAAKDAAARAKAAKEVLEGVDKPTDKKPSGPLTGTSIFAPKP